METLPSLERLVHVVTERELQPKTAKKKDKITFTSRLRHRLTNH